MTLAEQIAEAAAGADTSENSEVAVTSGTSIQTKSKSGK